MCESITVQQLFFLLVMKVILLLCVPRMLQSIAGWLDTALTLTV